MLEKCVFVVPGMVRVHGDLALRENKVISA
jgi:hypothetical protein